MTGTRFVYCLLLCAQVSAVCAKAPVDSMCVDPVVVMRTQTPELWQRYHSGWQMSVAGDIMMPLGTVTALAAGIPLLLWGDWHKEGLSDFGRGLIGLGVAAVAASIPLVVVGKQKSEHAYQEFMFDCSPRYMEDIPDAKCNATADESFAVALHLRTSANGIGLALHF